MDNLVERLRGIYRVPITDGLGPVGGSLEPANPGEFVRQFQTPPIQHEAAAEIERLQAETATLRAPTIDPVRIDTSILRERISRAVFDPAITEGERAGRTTADWQTDAVMRVLGYPATAEGTADV